jgi:hypothetical protein
MCAECGSECEWTECNAAAVKVGMMDTRMILYGITLEK